MSPSLTHSAPQEASDRVGYQIPLHGLASLRILIILAIGLGYASTMPIGPSYAEWGAHWGFDPSWYGVQLLFILSGFLAARSMAQGRTVIEFIKSRLWSLWPALIAVTLFVVLIIYPIMCAPDPAVRMSAGDLISYTLKTIFLIDPGTPMPGLLDDAKYMCLMQGAIWTLRLGLILHVGFLLGWISRILQHRKLVLAMSVLSIAAYVTIFDMAVQNPEFGAMIEPYSPMLRLGYAYLAGIAIYHWQGKLRLNKRRVIISAASIALITTGSYLYLPWTSLLEILGVSVWLTLCLGYLHNAPKFLRRCPRLSPVLYVTIWPAAQVIVALFPKASQFGVIEMSVILASIGAVVIFLLLRQARIQPARL